MDYILEQRILDSKDWATVLFVLSFALIAVTKTFFEARFNEFLKLFVTDKYLKIYKDPSHMMSWFTISLFFVQLISFAFFILILLNYFDLASKTDWVKYIQIITLLGVFVLSKYLVEKIIATSFKIEDFMEQFNLQKVSYRTFIGLLILPVNIILYYNDISSNIIIYGILLIILIVNALTYLISLKSYQSLLISKMFYFILYLCALEIAPYYFMYYWFTRR
ncbi:MAG TPA: DUF4271 domain-containing protein [Flavobacterium sp.]|uniref:DUF4271 domain-containing protein n=2 Tax=Flavobacterium TaxID=237 RepID=UPI0025C2D458|nr:MULTISPECIES: DUF4271 domain-containing protein [unclassified Flavobacterium]HRE77573.1 DUF4271 domain-containing protein [Flavobacterium sp.]